MPKQLDLLTTVIPKLSRVAVLRNTANSGNNAFLKGVQSAAQTRGVQVVPIEGRTPADIDQGFAKMRRERTDAVIVLGDTFFLQQRRKIAELALKYRLPSIYASEEYVQVGGLMSYGFDQIQNFVLAATFVDKIFKGANPGTLPFAQPTNFNFVINRATAKHLGLRIPDALLLRADKVIQ